MLLFREHPETTCKEEILTTLLRGEELAFLTLDYIREHPEEWDQESYFGGCDTTACFAGRAILLALGADWRCLARRMFPEEFLSPNPHPGDIAGKLLGWSHREAVTVFYCYTQDIDILEHKVKRILNGEILCRVVVTAGKQQPPGRGGR